MPLLSGDDAQAEGPNPLSSIRVRPVYPDWALAMRRCRAHLTDVVILGFRLTSARRLTFRRPTAGFRLTSARRLTFRRPTAGFRLTSARRLTFRRPTAGFAFTPHVAVAETAVTPLPSCVAAS
jgi:hypothetical protein